MARTSNPHAATLKAWQTRARAGSGSGSGSQSAIDYAKTEQAKAEQRRDEFRAVYKSLTDFRVEEMTRLGFEPGKRVEEADQAAWRAAWTIASARAEERLTEESNELVKLNDQVDAAKRRTHQAEAPLAVEQALRAKVGPTTIEDRAAVASILPRATEADFRALAMALPGSEVKVSIIRAAGKPPAIHIVARGGGLVGGAERAINTAADGSLVLRNVGIELDRSLAGVGLGSMLFGQQVITACRMRIRAITASCARGSMKDPMNGYYTWARMGYDGTGEILTRDYKKKTVRIAEQMRTPEGRREWKRSGDTFEGTFSLRPGSYSMRTLRAYLRRKSG